MKRRLLFGLSVALLLSLGCDQAPLSPDVVGPLQPPLPSATNVAPTARLRVAWSGQEGIASAGFTAVGSSDPEGDSLYYTWKFGDGTTITTTYVAQRHDYVDNGTYAVTVVVTDIHGAKGIASTQVTISNVAPSLQSWQFEMDPMPAPVPLRVTLHLSIADPGVLDNPVATIDWGDGTVSTDTTHIYREPRVYMPKVTVTDKDGASTSRDLYTVVWAYDPNVNREVMDYEVIELGTLGGTSTFARGLNNNGEVVGYGTNRDGVSHPFLWRDGVLTDLTPAGQHDGFATIINDAGWIAGRTHNAGALYEGGGELTLWRNGAFARFVAVPPGEYGSWPVKVGESGSVLVNVEHHEWPYAYLARNTGEVIQLAPRYAWGRDMNAREQIVGAVTTKYAGALNYESHAFLWNDGVLKDLGVLGLRPCENVTGECGWSEASDINDRGQIVGFATDESGLSRAVLWDPDDLTPRDLGFGSTSSRANFINENGQIAGDSYESGEAFFRDGEQVLTLGSLGGGWTRVVGMNEAGTVAGTSVTASGDVHGFVWTRATGMRDLGAGKFSAPGVGSVAVAINDRGDVLGYAVACANNHQGSCAGWAPSRATLWRRLTPQTITRR